MKFTTYHQAVGEDSEWVVRFNSWSRPDDPQLQELRTWCRQSFGKSGEWDLMNHMPPRWKDRIKWGEITFREQKDATWLLLKWTK